MQGSKHLALQERLQDLASRIRDQKDYASPELRGKIAQLEELAGEFALLLTEFAQLNSVQAVPVNNPLTLTQKVLNESPVVVVRWKATLELPVEFISANVAQFGFTPEELVSGETSFAQMIHPDDIASQRSGLLERVLSGAEWISHEYRLITRDGRIRWIDDHVHIERNSAGVATFFQGVLIDITERKLLQEQLLGLEGQYRTLFNLIADPVFILDRATGEILDANDAMLKIYGYTREELHRMNVLDVHAPEDRKNVRLDSPRKDYSLPVEYLHQDRDGHLVNVEVVSAEGHWRGIEVFVSCARNITARNEVQRKEKALLAEVESVNAELKDFAYIVSHDLKAPLRSISSLSEWLIGDYQDKLDADGQEMLQQLGAQSRRMYQLIEGILHYSSLGQINESRVEVDLNRTVADVLSLLAPPEEVKIEVQQNLPVLLLEPTRIAQVFQNLLSNAIKYLDKPQGYINVRAKAVAGAWIFWISDNGQGIEEKHFQKIFRIFQTLGGEKSFESTGVGLTVVKKIIEMYGGRVWVESIPGEGSCFYFTLLNKAAENASVPDQAETAVLD